MKVTFKLFASLQDYLPADKRNRQSVSLDLDDQTTIRSVIDQFGLPLESCHLVLVDGLFIPPEKRLDYRLKEGDTLAIWPPIAGG